MRDQTKPLPKSRRERLPTTDVVRRAQLEVLTATLGDRGKMPIIVVGDYNKEFHPDGLPSSKTPR